MSGESTPSAPRKGPIGNDSSDRFDEIAAENLKNRERAEVAGATTSIEEFNRSLMDGTADCVKVLSLEGQLLHMNSPGMCLMEIDDFSTFRGQRWADLWPAEARGNIRQSLQSAREGGSGSFTAFCPTAKGTPKWWEVTVSPVRNNAGLITMLLSVSRDITVRNRVEAVRESQRTALERLARGVPLGEVLEFLIGTIKEHTAGNLVGSLALLDTSETQFIASFGNDLPESYHDAVTGMYVSSQIGSCCRAVAERQSVVIEDVRRESQWSRFAAFVTPLGFCSAWSIPIVASDGKILGTFANYGRTPRRPAPEDLIFINEINRTVAVVIERVGVEEALRESESRFRLLADSISQLAWMCTELGNVTWYNKRWLDYTGLTFDELRDWGWKRVHHPDHIDRVVTSVTRSRESGEVWEDTFPLRGKDGEFRWFLSRAFPIRDPQGKIVRWFGTNTDITALRETESALRVAKDEAEAASRAKDKFIAQLSHELRTPLTPVLMVAAALSEDPRLPSDARDQLAMVQRNVALEARLIDDLLDMTRITHGKLVLKLERCAMHSLIQHVVGMVIDDAREKGVEINQELSAVRSHLTGDPARLQQVLWNLLRNAVKFTPRGGHVQIKSENSEDRGFRFSISDDGIGFASEETEKLFEPFHQSGSHQSGGLGLGLTIARAVMDLHRGSIRASSLGIGRGAKFVVELPDVIADSVSNGAAGSGGLDGDHPIPSKVPPQRLLLVEDHAPTLSVINRLLTLAGHKVTNADNVASALAAARTQEFDFVISDLGLPDGTGLELMEKLRAERGLRGIALSGYGMEEDVQRSRESGFVAHLIKPVTMSELQKVLQNLTVSTPA